MVGDKGAEAGAEHLPPPIELFYDNVLEKKGEAAAAFAAMKDAAKKKKTGKRKAGE